MAFPTLKVYAYFDDGPLTTAGGATDITSYVRLSAGVHITRGGTGDPDRPDQTGILNLTLDNRTRIFDPLYSAGSYYTKLTPKKQIVVKALWSGVEYPMFWGWVTGWPNTRTNAGKDNIVEIEAYDILGYLAGTKWSADPRHDYIAALDINYWYETPTVSTVPNEVGGGNTMAVYPLGLPANIQPSLVAESPSVPSVLFDSTFWWQSSDAAPYAVAFWIQTTTQPADEYLHDVAPLFTDYSNTGSYIYVRIGLETSGRLVYSADNNGTASTTLTGYSKLNDGQPHHVCIAYNTFTGYTFYVDGQPESFSTSTVGAGYTPGLQIDTVGATYWGSTSPVYTAGASTILKDCYIQDIVFSGASNAAAFTAAEVLEMYNRSIGDLTESTATRADRILDNAAIPAGYADLTSASLGTVKALNIQGQATLAALHQIERTEQGRVYASKDGKLTFRQRHYAYEDTRSNTVQVTFSDDGSDETYRTFGHRYSYEDIANAVTVVSPLIQKTETDTTSQTAYGENSIDIDTLLATQQEVYDMALGVKFLRADPALRVDPMQVSIQPSNWVTILGLELADRVRVEATPMGVGSQIVADVLLDQIHWDIDEAWRMTIAGAPVPPDPVDEGFWVLGTSELDTGTVLAF